MSLKRMLAVAVSTSIVFTILVLSWPHHSKSFTQTAVLESILVPGTTAAPPAVPLTYTVQPGDTLSTIARQQLGTSNWRWLYQANRKIIGPDPDSIRPGEQILLKLEKPKQQTSLTSYSPPVTSSPQRIAASMLGSFGWAGSQLSCLIPLWDRESGWRVSAYNPSGAFGIPQALPGSKMASAGADWQTSAATQIRWGLGYIKASYGSPCGAWNHEEADGWY